MSRLVAIEAMNFMSIEKARVEFDERNIINFVGYNDSGKSAMRRLVEIILYDAYSNEQVNYIQDDKEFFAGGLEFDDGVEINKYKYRDGKSVWEMLRYGEMVYTNKLDSGIASIQDVPSPIAKYLGVVEDEHTGEKLNVRTEADKLFLIQTTGGDNYKIINNILRFDILADAQKKLNEDRNKVSSDLLGKSSSLQTLRNEANNIQVVDDATLKSIESTSLEVKGLKQQFEFITETSKQLNTYKEVIVQPELPTIDTGRLITLTQIQEAKRGVDIPVNPELQPIDTNRLRMIQEIGQLRRNIDIDIIPETKVVDIEQLRAIQEVGKAFAQWMQANQVMQQIEQEREIAVNQLQQMSVQYNFKICKSCGEIVD